MQRMFLRRFFHLAAATLLICLNPVASAQPTGLLYDPEPPVDSAYVRIILASPEGSVDVFVDGRPRIRNLEAGAASEYMVLAVGKHTVALHLPGKSAAQLEAPLEVVRGRAMTVAFPALRADAAPVLFEDKANSNKLKALLAVYHLNAKAGPLDVLTADGGTKVFSDVAYGASRSLQVNPISIEMIATKVDDKVPQARTSLAMTQGGTYSVLLLSGKGGKLTAHAVQNKIERYTGK